MSCAGEIPEQSVSSLAAQLLTMNSCQQIVHFWGICQTDEQVMIVTEYLEVRSLSIWSSRLPSADPGVKHNQGDGQHRFSPWKSWTREAFKKNQGQMMGWKLYSEEVHYCAFFKGWAGACSRLTIALGPDMTIMGGCWLITMCCGVGWMHKRGNQTQSSRCSMVQCR